MYRKRERKARVWERERGRKRERERGREKGREGDRGRDEGLHISCVLGIAEFFPV